MTIKKWKFIKVFEWNPNEYKDFEEFENHINKEIEDEISYYEEGVCILDDVKFSVADCDERIHTYIAILCIFSVDYSREENKKENDNNKKGS